MNILQKEDLDSTSFANTNSNAAGGIAIRTDAGSTVGNAIATATPAAQTLSIAGQTLSLSGGGGSIAVPSTVFATPAETLAGVDTGKALDPADLTAKLANQPASGACTDREDVVWDGTILQGAAKHYSFSGGFPNIYFPVLSGTAVAAGVLANASITITNPSQCRPLRISFNSSAGASCPDVSSASGQNIFSYVYVGATAYLINLGQENFITNGRLSSIGSGITASSYFDLAPGASQVITLYLEMIGASLLFNDTGAIRAFATYTAQTI